MNGAWVFTSSKVIGTPEKVGRLNSKELIFQARSCTFEFSEVVPSKDEEFEEQTCSVKSKVNDKGNNWFYTDASLRFTVVKVMKVPIETWIQLPQIEIRENGFFDGKTGTKLFDETLLKQTRCNMIGNANGKKVVGVQKNIIKTIYPTVFHFATWGIDQMIGAPLFDNKWRLIGMFLAAQTSFFGYTTSEGVR